MAEIAGRNKVKGARFVRFYPSDWRSGCLSMTLEQQGLYVAICAFQWETGRRLFLDDKQAAHAIGLNPKNYRKVRDQLLEMGKIQQHEDGYSNARAESELGAALGAGTASRRPAEEVGMGSARDVHQEHKNGRDPVAERRAGENAIADQSEINLQSIADQSLILVGKYEENQCVSIEPIANSQEPRQTDRASAGQSAFNEASENLIQDAARWMNADRHHAVKWLSSTISASSAEAVMAAYAQLLESQTKGRLIADPIRYIGKTAPTLKGRVAAAQPETENVLMFDGKPFKLTGMRNVKPKLEAANA